mmetsp:Transcript_9927/g.16815  ORF Transcript_9927/g.16815 Transcript_9927/m.16815 type:complete len:209 (+) Transcript_9927:1073-1699(+)
MRVVSPSSAASRALSSRAFFSSSSAARVFSALCAASFCALAVGVPCSLATSSALRFFRASSSSCARECSWSKAVAFLFTMARNSSSWYLRWFTSLLFRLSTRIRAAAALRRMVAWMRTAAARLTRKRLRSRELRRKPCSAVAVRSSRTRRWYALCAFWQRKAVWMRSAARWVRTRWARRRPRRPRPTRCRNRTANFTTSYQACSRCRR